MHRRVPARHHIVIQNCVFSGRWGGLAVGSEMSGGAYDIFAEDRRINSLDFPGRYNSRNPVFLKTNKKRGGAVDGVYVRRFRGRQIDRDCIHLITRCSNRTSDHPAVIRNVRVEHMVHDGAGSAINPEGLSSDPFLGIHIEHYDFTNMANPNIIGFAPDLVLRKMFVNGTEANA
ncbi:hypothetical protein [Streptomyces sp. NPDC057557]|uniref:hypothetical protein n=1 Tax=Streptomyces sp. NPDC057557 TaxID=3346167 RepID=UPI0036B10A49